TQVVRTALGAGTGTDPVVLPSLGSTVPPGVVADGRLTVAGLLLGGRAAGDQVLVVAGEDGVLAVPTGDLVARPVSGMDPDLGLVEVSAGSLEVAASADALADGAWARAVARAQVALGHEL